MRINSIEIIGLFNTFNHKLDLKSNSDMTILLGQNGLGKTAILSLVNSMFSYEFDKLIAYPYRELSLMFSDRTKLQIIPVYNKETGAYESVLTYRKRGIENSVKTDEIRKNRNMIAHGIFYEIPQDRYKRTRSELWLDSNTGAYLTTDELIDIYPDAIIVPEGIDRHGCPLWLSKIISTTPVFLISTKRLQTISTHRVNMGRDVVDVKDSVNECAKDFLQKLIDTKAKASSVASELDRSYPRRLISELGVQTKDIFQKISRTENVYLNVINNLKETEKKRRKLVEVGLMDSARDETFSSLNNKLSEDVVHALNIYLEDSSKKLDVYQPMSDKISLFIELINSRFIKKEISVSKEGLVLKSTVTKEVIPLSKLSSGEQHLFILYYNMLFKCPEDVLILMDEPEISLNISWQKSLVEDLERIMKLSHISILMATHSPSIVRNYWDLTCELSTE